jgi:hypothetical protein
VEDAGRGRAHDLDGSFARVNHQYFAGQMAKPRLSWSRTLTTRLLGHYLPGPDAVMVSATLDDPRVSVDAVHFVMRRELVHTKPSVSVVNSRRLAHTPAVRIDEQHFAHYAAAK